MLLTIKNYLANGNKIVSLEDSKGRKYFQTLDSDSQGVKVAKTWASRNGYLVLQ